MKRYQVAAWAGYTFLTFGVYLKYGLAIPLMMWGVYLIICAYGMYNIDEGDYTVVKEDTDE